MNKLRLFLFSLSAFAFMSCSSNENAQGGTTAQITVTNTEISAPAEGNTYNVAVTTSRGEWTAYSDNSWITVQASNTVSANGNVEITVAENNTTSERTGVVNIKSGISYQEITINQEKGKEKPIVAPAGYKLVWNDEFNTGSVLSSDWTHEVQPAGWVNNELQTYVNGEADGRRVTEIKDGNLNINMFKGSDGKIYSGRVYAKVNTGWLYGYFEARIKLPKGKGTWPAWWMMPVNNNFTTNPWPDCGEIDIMEEVGFNPNYVSSSLHTKDFNHTIGNPRTHELLLSTAESDFHTYACEWTHDYIAFIFDGVEHYRVNNDGSGRGSWPFTYAFYPILNLAWGGMWGGQQGVDENVLPVTMQVDYVRVFQKQ